MIRRSSRLGYYSIIPNERWGAPKTYQTHCSVYCDRIVMYAIENIHEGGKVDVDEAVVICIVVKSSLRAALARRMRMRSTGVDGKISRP